jgi:hypothetical protein
MNLNQIGSYADIWCAFKQCDYKEPRSPRFHNVAERQMKEFEIGLDLYNLYKERHPSAKK